MKQQQESSGLEIRQIYISSSMILELCLNINTIDHILSAYTVNVSTLLMVIHSCVSVCFLRI